VIKRLFFIFGMVFLVSVSSTWCETFTEFLERETLLGSPGNFRENLEDKGLFLELIYTGESFTNTRGGLNTEDTIEYKGDISLFLALETEKAGWWNDGLFFLHLQESHGQGITEDHVGDFQTLSNFDADDFKQVSEIWYQHNFFDDHFWLKIGKQEANTDFAYVDYGLEFINSSPGLIPTVPIPSYPDQDWGVTGWAGLNDWFTVTAGLFQADIDGGRSVGNTLDDLVGPLLIIEPNFHYALSGKTGRLGVGLWWSGLEAEVLDDPSQGEEPWGVYLLWDQEVWAEASEDEQGIGVFAQYGWADQDTSEIEHYVGAGAQWVGAIPSRDEDILGLGAFTVFFNDDAGFEEDTETAIEFFYKAQLAGWMSLKGDVQYITHPGGADEEDAVALGLQWEVIF
jgi:porin